VQKKKRHLRETAGQKARKAGRVGTLAKSTGGIKGTSRNVRGKNGDKVIQQMENGAKTGFHRTRTYMGKGHMQHPTEVRMSKKEGKQDSRRKGGKKRK